ncbi:hypothetical protein GQ457_17G005480 [Hibiscus cannabinus]
MWKPLGPLYKLNTTLHWPNNPSRTKSPKHPLAINVRKSLQVTLSNLPMTYRKNRRASSSRTHMPTRDNSSLDKNLHSSVVLPENSDPNIPPFNQDLAMQFEPPDMTLSGRPLDHQFQFAPLSPNESSEVMKMMHSKATRCRCGHPKFVSIAKNYIRDSKPNLVVFVEPCINGQKVDNIITTLGFPDSHHVEALRFSRGIWLAWYDSISIDIMYNHFLFVHDGDS